MRKRNTTGEYAIPNVEGCAASRSDAPPMDSDTFAGFYQRSAPPLRAYLARVSQNPALADDLVQESYLRFLCASLPDCGEVNHRRYLFRIATNLLHDHWRKPRASSVEDVPEYLLASPDVSAGIDSRATLDPAMARMKPRERQLLWLAHAEGYSHREIAEITGLAATSIRLLLFRARRKIARLLREPICGGEASMTLRSCSCEKEIAAALKTGHWPDGCDRELRAHVETCSSCADLVLVTEAFQRARTESLQEIPAGSPGLLWWRAQLRNRNAAATKLNRPITVAQIFAWLVTVLSMIAVVASQYRHGFRWELWWLEFSPSHASHSFLTAASKLDWNLVLLAPSLALLLLFSGVVVYLVAAKQ